MNQTALLRYNFRVMMLNNWLLMAFPLAVSQLTVFWFLLTRRFTPDLPAISVELVTPLLAAFLGAHLLSAEYRSRIGAVLASRPVNISRIVVLRLIVMLALVWTLAVISLLAYYFNMEPYDLWPPLLACIPSTLFLTMLAITFATVFRHSLAGFGIAALYWAFDLVPGAAVNPYLSLRSLTLNYAAANNPDHQTFVDAWWISKVILLVAALVLYLIHDRLVFTLGTSLTMRMRRRGVIGAVALFVLYLVSGAILKVSYGYSHRGKLSPNDVAWFRYQFAPYGPIPMASLFGPSFKLFLGEMANPWRLPEGEDPDKIGDTIKHQRDLKTVLDEMPDSPWAATASDTLARLKARGKIKTEDAVSYYRYIVDRYPHSPYVENALRQIARLDIDGHRVDDARSAYLELLQRLPGSAYRSEALRFLVETDQKAGHLPEAARWAEQWTAVAPVQEKFEAWMDLATIRKAQGDSAGAKQAAQAVLTSLQEYKRAGGASGLNLSPSQKIIREQLANRAEEFAKSLQ